MNMRQPFHALSVAVVSLIMSCSCAAPPHDSAASMLPTDVPINKGAGRGGCLTLTLRLETGEEFPCTVDTGSPLSLLPKILEPKLGKRLGTKRFTTLGGPRETAHIYAAPKLYLGTTPLVTAATIGTWDSPSGVLGMDCLRHYCVQLDFEAGKLRFLAPERLDPAGLGKSFPLISTRYTYIRHAGFLEQKATALLLDTGFPFDAMVHPRLFKQAATEKGTQPIPLLKDGKPAGTVPGMACLSSCVWDDVNYTNVVVESGRPPLLGLKFLARHKVTFNFPKRVMYLQPFTTVPPSAEHAPQP